MTDTRHSGDLDALYHYLATLPLGEEISDAAARTIAALYHGGQASFGYSFASTGAITDPSDIWRDLFASTYLELPRTEQELADRLGTYLIRCGPRPPVPGWAELWIRP
ncbi:hypothetical protein [Qaidamihabitans albus]|uniref:hypothetical protein n=1 Tax=Qaidamihabitans albus TaxID=2795733 RepID=UPI0018F26148|nr:hypothetical protein [Qaidamihabitans albus]